MDRSEAFNSISHLVGAAAAIAGSAVLVVYAAAEGDGWKVVSFSIYGTTLFLLYLFSTLYHWFRGRAKTVFRILDHQAIYLLIAGTYTPFSLVTLRGGAGWSLFGAIWAAAVSGIVLDAFPQKGRRVLPVFIYVAMGWLALVALNPLLDALRPGGFAWLLAGGILYTSGVVFFVMSHWYPWAHGAWHLFVLAGSVSHYFAILLFT